MAESHYTFYMGDLLKQTTVVVTVKEQPQTRIRFWVGKRLLTLAIRTIGCQVEYHAMEEPKIPDGFEVIRK